MEGDEKTGAEMVDIGCLVVEVEYDGEGWFGGGFNGGSRWVDVGSRYLVVVYILVLCFPSFVFVVCIDDSVGDSFHQCGRCFDKYL